MGPFGGIRGHFVAVRAVRHMGGSFLSDQTPPGLLTKILYVFLHIVNYEGGPEHSASQFTSLHQETVRYYVPQNLKPVFSLFYISR